METTNRAKLITIGAVVVTGLLKFVMMDWLEWRFFISLEPSYSGWVICFGYKKTAQFVGRVGISANQF